MSSLDDTLTVTHQVHVSGSFVNSLQEEAVKEARQSPPFYQFGEPNAWLDAYGNECECVACEMLTHNYVFPDAPPDWGENKPRWHCSGSRQPGWEERERERRRVTAYLVYYGHPRHEGDWNEITTKMHHHIKWQAGSKRYHITSRY
ncbi:hypothetical protein FGG08_006054 [Glutinoglossum americanum]|uniref:Uncharacterized protein n=1 Tax=Glutinoglossum americanum TaxID=1670608 RepID=A0A9P8I490_9PEZI|nr:hypothetical protein FGG08_006054 [Glutinoglossum americanum]